MTTSLLIDALPGDPMQDLMDHLLTAPRAAWLDVMRRADPQEHYDLITWMLDQPECDATIAMVAFYRANAADCLRRRVGIVPDQPDRDAIPAVVADGFASGRFEAFELGLAHGELDAEMDEMARVLAEIPSEDRIFDVPMSFLVAPRAKEAPLDAEWSPKYDADTAQLYRAAGLLVPVRKAEIVRPPSAEIPGKRINGLLSRLTAIVRKPTAAPPE